MKKFISSLIVLLTAYIAVGQGTALEREGSKRFSNYDYYASISMLEAVDSKSPEVLRQLAESYRMTHNSVKEEAVLEELIRNNRRIAQDYIDYARVLMKNQKYAQAEQQIRIYETLNPEDALAQRFYLLNESLAGYSQYGTNFTVNSWNNNTVQEDFSPFLLSDRLYFTSSRTNVKLVKRRWNGTRLAFLDVWSVDPKAAQTEKPERVKGDDINRKYHDGPVSFNADGSEMYITRTDYSARGTDGARQLQLLISTKNGESWTEPELMPFTSREYSSGLATISADGSILIFASDMPGGKGGVDLYKVERRNGMWTTPKNLEAINTSGDEMFPFLHPDGILIFASNGLPGYGGFDLFAGPWKDNTVARVQNLGAPLNSSTDDFSLWMDKQMTMGYFASNRPGGMGSDDIYAFSMKKPLSFGRTVSGIAVDEKGNVLSGVRVVFKDDNNSVLGEDITETDGSYSFETDLSGNFSLTGTRTNYFEGESSLAITEDAPDEITKNVTLEKDPGFALVAVVSDRKSNLPLEGVKVTLINNLTGQQEVLRTGEKGDLMRPIREKKINDRISYNLKLEKDGYLSRTITYNRLLDKEGRYVVSDEMNLSLQKMDVGVDLAKAIDLKPIYFDLAKFNIRPDAAVELEKIIQIMNENPTMVVELGSHTDCRGTSAKNLSLSQKRANSSAEYIKKRISNPTRISGKGYGESKILNGCECEGKVKSICPENVHAENRRTEFIVVKM